MANTEVIEKPQTAFFEQLENDPQVLSAVTGFMAAKDDVLDKQENLRNAEKFLQAAFGDKDLIDGQYRIGEYVVTVSYVAAHKRLRVKRAKSK